MLTVTQRQSPNPDISVTLTLGLTAEERTRSRHRFQSEDGKVVFLRLPRGTLLQDGDILQDETGAHLIRIVAKPEPVLTAIASNELDLLRAAYHLGNRHVPVEITPHYLRISPDKVLQRMLEQLHLQVATEVSPFYPEAGAYGHQHHPNS
ncbi:urease accessory protein UreE [Calothrix sp. UHCC 0171]|uniref:urease accessory protein UreE n=1 Tax=Calothrix sp. UHCC 0171 TaxID=3110245 RepID=UPI002B20FF67|nr:urease accessory protein UreE [Calothrix sp. UHCC 0171]MEA5571703.1 urease accessory protein UreE [Calothrix sp. UHCC 0171]